MNKKRILILSANPSELSRLRLDEEVREIDEGLRRSKKRDHFEIQQKWAVRIKDLRRALLDYKPDIVHFCGHGNLAGIFLEDENGTSVLVSTEALASLFKVLSIDSKICVECVILNSCFSNEQANSLRQHVHFVIGMNNKVTDSATKQFTVGFYDALGAGMSIQQSFEIGRNGLQLENISKNATPILYENPNLQKKRRIFLSYKRNCTPDEPLALQICAALEAEGHYVFIDQNMPVGMNWVKRIDDELRQADYLISLLSEHSSESEMVRAEIEKAHSLSKDLQKPLVILPVRVKFWEPFQYPLNVFLNHLNWATWDDENDSVELLEALKTAISGRQLPLDGKQHNNLLREPPLNKLPSPFYTAQPPFLEMPEGTMDPESTFYIERPEDQIALQAMERQGVTVTIKAPRQMGKSSLLIRAMKEARRFGKRPIFLDFQLFDRESLQNADSFFHRFCSWLTDELEMKDRVDEFWKTSLSNPQRCVRYIGRYILKEINEPLLLAMDEVDAIFDKDYRSDFFGMLRSWHNKRISGSNWKNLDMILVTSTEPYQLIENLNQSPFNVGEIISLTDFSSDQVERLNHLHNSPFSEPELRHLVELLNGHPYLTRRALYWVAKNRGTVSELFSTATMEDGPFGDHLRYHLFRMHEQHNLFKSLLDVINHQKCRDESLVFRLQAAGLVGWQGGKPIPRCQLYAQYFKSRKDK